MNDYFIYYFEKYLNQLKEEIEAYEDEKSMWEVAGDINNSGGNLCYHLVGNLNHYIGVGIGAGAYKRNRPLEFTIKDVPRTELLTMVDETSQMIKKVLTGIDLEQAYPASFFNQEGSRAFFLFRLLNHLSYHLGQINYHRRLIASQ